MHHPLTLHAFVWGCLGAWRESWLCSYAKGLQGYRIRPRCETLPDMLCYSITLLYGESPPCLILSQCQQFSFLSIQILTFPATFWPHLFTFLRIPTQKARIGLDSGINATALPSGAPWDCARVIRWRQVAPTESKTKISTHLYFHRGGILYVVGCKQWIKTVVQ